MGALKVELKDIAMDFHLRADYKFYNFSIKNKYNLINNTKFNLVRLKDILKPEYIRIKYEEGITYKGLPTDAEYFDEDGEVLKYQAVTKDNHPGRLMYEGRPGQILISSLKGAKAPVVALTGNCERIVVSNGFYIFRVKENMNVMWKYIYYILKSPLFRRILDESLSRGIGISAYKEYDLLRIRIPLPPKDTQEQLVYEIEKLESRIRKEKKNLIPLQDAIDRVFIKHGVKSPESETRVESFKTSLLNIGKQNFLRCGVQYRFFWDVHNGMLLDGKSKYQISRLGDLMKLHKTKILKKGTLEKEYTLVELDDIEQGTGKILNKNRIVIEIGSDKICFDDADLITTKLRPYLGYTIMNIPELELIGTTELLPFKANLDRVNPEYLKYILLSHEYLKKSQLLMYGKEHPRIHPLDLLQIKIPVPPKDIQENIISEIHKYDEINEMTKQRLSCYRNEINRLMSAYLTNEDPRTDDSGHKS